MNKPVILASYPNVRAIIVMRKPKNASSFRKPEGENVAVSSQKADIPVSHMMESSSFERPLHSHCPYHICPKREIQMYLQW